MVWARRGTTMLRDDVSSALGTHESALNTIETRFLDDRNIVALIALLRGDRMQLLRSVFRH